jgi:sortase A
VLTLIALGAYWVSFKTRRNWIGALVGIVPFIVTLYFFYENVNRLLPPTL